jgi:MinD superfamily P-loop ATPase
MEKPIEIAVISGKGGTGKTVLASSLARLTTSKAIADCDVDAPNMHLLLNPTVRVKETLNINRMAVIEEDICTRCGDCFRTCRFAAVIEKDAPEGWRYSIDPLACTGCAACTRVCPANAIDIRQAPAGVWFVSDSEFGPLVHASRAPGSMGSDELVRIVRREALRAAAREGLRYVIIDGPAGIGGPAIAAVLGIALALVIAEPTLSGIHDLRRVMRLLNLLGIRAAGVINKHDLNAMLALEVEDYLGGGGIPLLGRIPFSREVNKAVVDGKFIVDIRGNPAAEEIRRIARETLTLVGG